MRKIKTLLLTLCITLFAFCFSFATFGAFNVHSVYEVKADTQTTYTLTFDLAGGNIDGQTEYSITQAAGTAVSVPDPGRFGYAFWGWDQEVPSTMPAENMTITAEWFAGSYNAVFDADGGAWADGSTEIRIESVFDSPITPPETNPTREGFTFAGWDPEVGNMDEEGKVFYAQWTSPATSHFEHTGFSVTDNGDATHSWECAQCDAMATETHVANENNVCVGCNAVLEAKVITYETYETVAYYSSLAAALLVGSDSYPVRVYALADCADDLIIDELLFYCGEYIFNGEVTNYGHIDGGTFNGEVTNYEVIDDGTFNGTVTNNDYISNGTFNGEVTNNSNIGGGTFNNAVTNNSSIGGGTFYGTVTSENDIHGGTFYGTVTNNDYIYGGTFNNAVTNLIYIQGGTFNGEVTNYGGINDGTFSGTVTNNVDIRGGTFNNAVTSNNGYILGGNFKSTLTVKSGNIDNTSEYYSLSLVAPIINEGATVECIKHINWEAGTCANGAACWVCNEIGEPIADNHAWNDGEITTDPTCMEKGIKTYTCTHNSAHTKTENVAIDENAHSWNDGEVTTDPTCSAVGVKTYTCTHNNAHTKTEDVAIDENAHAWNEGEVTTQPTCSAVGTKTYTCTHNNAHTKTEDVAIDPENHNFGEWTVTKEATATETGEKERSCACGAKETETIPATGAPVNPDGSSSEGSSDSSTNGGSSSNNDDNVIIWGCFGTIAGSSMGIIALVGAAAVVFLTKRKQN